MFATIRQSRSSPRANPGAAAGGTSVSSSLSSLHQPPRVFLCLSWRRVAIILTCCYVVCLLLVFRSIGSLHNYDLLNESVLLQEFADRAPPAAITVSSVPLSDQEKPVPPLPPLVAASTSFKTTNVQKEAHTPASPSPSSTTANVSAAVTAINAIKEPRVDDWYKEIVQRIENSNINHEQHAAVKSCRRTASSDISGNSGGHLMRGENEFFYYSLDPLAACRATTTSSPGRKFMYFNPYNRSRILCGHTIDATVGTLELDEPCLEPPRLFPVIPSVKTASQLPPTTTRFNDPNQKGSAQPFADCDIPCHHAGHLHILSTRTVDGTPFTFTFSMEGPQYYPQLTIRDSAYKQNRFYSTTSFRSEVPLPYFSYAEYKIQNKPLDYEQAESAAVFLARNCGSRSKREALVKALQESPNFRIDSLSACLKNAQPPPGVGLSNKENVMRHYLFYLAFENQRVDDYVTEKLWGPYVAGTVPVYFGAPNIKELAPNNSYIDVDDFPTPDDLAIYLQKVASNRTLYESYHAWRKQPLPPNFTAKYNISKTHSTCRTCRWAYARMYGLGWSHENQTVSDELRSTSSRRVCLDNTSNKNGGGFITRPFREVWLDARTNQQILADADTSMAGATVSSCQEVNSQTRVVHLDHGRLQRTVWEQDGVIDVVLEHGTGQQQQQQQEQNLKRRHVPPPRKLRLRIDTTLEGPVTLTHIREGQVRFQNLHSRFTLLTWPTRVANITHVAATDGSALVLDLHQVSAHSVLPLRLRIIMEDVDLFHKGADRLENYFGGLMIDDFFQPVEAFYQDKTEPRSNERER